MIEPYNVLNDLGRKTVATVTFVILFYLELLTGWPLVFALVRTMSAEIASQAVYTALVFQFGAALLSLMVYKPVLARISGKIGSTLTHISAHGLSQATSDQLIRTTKLEEQLVSLENIVHRLATQMMDWHDSPRAGELGRNIMESIDFMILTAIDAIESNDSDEIETLELLTQDRSAMMTKIRHSYFDAEKELSNKDRNFVLDITILFENAVYTLGRYGHLLRSA